MAEKNFFLLLFIAKNNGLESEFVSSTTKIAQRTGMSQQTVSRKLRELSSSGFISLQASPEGVRARISAEGKKILHTQFYELSELFSKEKTKKLFGTVQSGLGEGKYYLSFKQYSFQIKEKIGFDPFVGTLNLKVYELDLISFKKNIDEIYIGGFDTKQRSFGGLKSFKVKIEGKINGAVIFPDRSTLPSDTAEVIAPINLRKKFDLKDGDKIYIEVKK